MSDKLFFDNKEYILGATIGPKEGTGPVSYSLLGLDGYKNQKFIIISNKNSGISSNIVGPFNLPAISYVQEQRNAINLFSWEFPYRSLENAQSYLSGSTTNLFLSTEDWGNTKFWLYGQTMAPGQTDPFGGTGAYMWRSSSSGGATVITTRDQTPQAPMVLEPNQKYILSFWMDLSRGITFLPAYGTPSPTVFYFGSASFIPLTQILPYQGTEGQPTQFAPGASGWVRYAWSFTPVSGSVHVRLLSGSAGAGTYREMYVYGPQLEKA